MKLFSLLPKRLVHFACNSPKYVCGENSTKRWISPVLVWAKAQGGVQAPAEGPGRPPPPGGRGAAKFQCKKWKFNPYMSSDV